MDIIIDSNIIVPEYSLTGSKTHVLLTSIPSTVHTLYVPEVVLDEVVGTAVKKLLKARSEIEAKLSHDTMQKLPDVMTRLFSLPTKEQFIGVTEGYRGTLVETLQSVGAKFLPYPSTTHKELVQHLMHQERPFQPERDDEGYRDTLVWETVIEHALRSGNPIIFLSLDKKAFADTTESRLHPDLIRDLRLHGIDPDSVTLFTDWNAFAAMHLAVLAELTAFRDRVLVNMTSGLGIQTLIAERVQEAILGWEFTQTEFPISAVLISTALSEVQEVGEASVVDIVKLPTGEFLCRFQLDLSAVIDYEVEDRGLPGSETRTARGQKVGPLSVGISLTLDEAVTFVTSFAVDSTKVKSGLTYRLSPAKEMQLAAERERYDQQYQYLTDHIIKNLDERGARITRDAINPSGMVLPRHTTLIAGWPGRRVAIYPYAGWSIDDVLRISHVAGVLGSFVKRGNLDAGVVVADDESQQERTVGNVEILRLSSFPGYVERQYQPLK